MEPEPHPWLHVAARPRDGDLDVTLRGELDLATRLDLITTVADALTDDVQIIRIDAEELEFCDSTGLSALVGLRRAAEMDGRHLYLTNLQPAVLKVLETTGLTRLTEPPSWVTPA